VYGNKFNEQKKIDGVYQGCIFGKHLEDKFVKGKAWRASSPPELVHINIMVSFPHPSMSRAKYVLTLLMIGHGKRGCIFLEKNEVFEYLKDFKALVEKVLCHCIHFTKSFT
jgi:hypothetical protein